MGTDIANWLQVNIVNNPQILQSLIALIILLVAYFLFFEKPTEKIPFRRVLGAALFVFGIFIFLYANIADLADVFIAWATIVLAGAALLSFAESRSLRKQYREREERDRKERLLDKICDWVLEIHTSSLKQEMPMVEIQPEKAEIIAEANVLRRYSLPLSRAEYIKAIVDRNFKNELAEDIDKLIEIFEGFWFLKNRELDMGDAREDFTDPVPDIMNRIAEQIKSKPETETELLNTYTEEKAKSCVVILNKIGNILSNL